MTAGLHWIHYRHPRDDANPDNVTIIRTTNVKFDTKNFPTRKKHGAEKVSRNCAVTLKLNGYKEYKEPTLSIYVYPIARNAPMYRLVLELERMMLKLDDQTDTPIVL